MWVKICGTTNLDDALLAAEAGADAVGFVFAKSARQVTSEQVSAIVRQLPEGLEKVGVFTTDDPFEIEHHVACSGLTAAQLHGAFDGDMLRTLSNEFGGELKIIQTVTYAAAAVDQEAEDRRFTETLRAVLAEPAVWAVLLDTAVGGGSGGTGVAFDWQQVAELIGGAKLSRGAGLIGEAGPGAVTAKLIVAGGLRPENVGQAIAQLEPWGVDVVSGVERSKGLKDAGRVREFLAAARHKP